MANQIFACAMGFAVVCATLCFLGTPAIVNWLGADGGTAYYARVYLRVVIWDMPFLYMVNIFSAVHQAQGDTVRPMFLNLGGITLNLFLDPFFMIILNLGTAGAALATLLAKAIPAIVAFGLLCRQENDICLNSKKIPVQQFFEKHILQRKITVHILQQMTLRQLCRSTFCPVRAVYGKQIVLFLQFSMIFSQDTIHSDIHDAFCFQ